MPQIKIIITSIEIFAYWIFETSLSMKRSFQKITLVNCSIIPHKFTVSLLLSLEILSLISSFIVIFLALTMWLSVDPTSFILQICDFVGIYSQVLASSDEIAGVMKNKEASLFQTRLKSFLYFALVIPCKLTILFNFIGFDISFGQIILIFLFLVNISDEIGRFYFPYFVGGWSELCKFFNFFFYMMISDGQIDCFASNG